MRMQGSGTVNIVPRRRESGLTLIELMVVLVLLSVVVMITMGALRNVNGKARLEAAAYKIKAIFDRAPAEAVRQGTRVTVRYVASTRRFELVYVDQGGTEHIAAKYVLPRDVVFEGPDPTSWPTVGSHHALGCDTTGRLIDPSSGSRIMTPQSVQVTLEGMRTGMVQPKFDYLIQVFPLWSCQMRKLRS